MVRYVLSLWRKLRRVQHDLCSSKHTPGILQLHVFVIPILARFCSAEKIMQIVYVVSFGRSIRFSQYSTYVTGVPPQMLYGSHKYVNNVRPRDKMPMQPARLVGCQMFMSFCWNIIFFAKNSWFCWKKANRIVKKTHTFLVEIYFYQKACFEKKGDHHVRHLGERFHREWRSGGVSRVGDGCRWQAEAPPRGDVSRVAQGCPRWGPHHQERQDAQTQG